MVLSGKHIGRHECFDGLLGFGLQDGVALQAAREKSGAHAQATFLDDLTQLLHVLITFDENKFGRLFLLEPPVASKNQPIFLARRMNQAAPRQMPPINNVQAQNAEPAGKPAQHPVRGKFYFLARRLVHCFYRRSHLTSQPGIRALANFTSSAVASFILFD